MEDTLLSTSLDIFRRSSEPVLQCLSGHTLKTKQDVNLCGSGSLHETNGFHFKERMPTDNCLIKHSSRVLWSIRNTASSTTTSTIVYRAMIVRDLCAQLSVKLDGAKPRFMK